MSADDPFGAAAPLSLFPLHNVLFPGGLLQLKVFEARYLDLMSACLREKRPFGVVALTQGAEVHRAGGDGAVAFESIGTLAELIDVDSDASGILAVRCRGTRRFALHAPQQQADGLWLARTSAPLPDRDAPPGDDMASAVRALADALTALKAEGIEPFLPPHRYDSAAWVADRWCEILPFSVGTKQRLLELPDGGTRLGLIAEFLRKEGVIEGA